MIVLCSLMVIIISLIYAGGLILIPTGIIGFGFLLMLRGLTRRFGKDIDKSTAEAIQRQRERGEIE